MYRTGKGVPQDDVRAYMWFNIASANGVEDAQEAREAVAGIMTPVNIAKTQQMAAECLASGYQDCGY